MTEDKHPNKKVCNVSYPFFRAKAKVKLFPPAPVWLHPQDRNPLPPARLPSIFGLGGFEQGF